MYIDFNELKERVNIEQVVRMLGLTMKPSAGQLRGVCPRCKGDDRTLAVTPSKEAWYCFRAQKGGDLISLVAHARDLSNREAAELINDHFPTTSPQRTEEKGLRERLDELEARVADLKSR